MLALSRHTSLSFAALPFDSNPLPLCFCCFTTQLLTPPPPQDRISVHANDGAQFAKSHDLDFAQVSAHKLPEVEPVFATLAATFHQQYVEALSTLATIV